MTATRDQRADAFLEHMADGVYDTLLANGSGSHSTSRKANAQLNALKAQAREVQAQGWGVARLKLSNVDHDHPKLGPLIEHYIEVTYYSPESKTDRRMYDIADSWGFILGNTWPYRFRRVQRDDFGYVRSDFRTEIEARDFLRRYWRDFEECKRTPEAVRS